MKYSVLQSCEWNYPDIDEYESASASFDGLALKGGYATFQIHLSSLSGAGSVSCDVPDTEIYEEVSVRVEANPNYEETAPHFPERVAPYRVYDCLKPYKGAITPEGETCSAGIYIAIRIPEDGIDTIAGNVIISDSSDEISVPVSVTVIDAPLPEETLKIMMGFSSYEITRRHDIKSHEELIEYEDKYLKLLRRQHQNRLYLSHARPTKDDPKKFDFRHFDAFVKRTEVLGYKAYHIVGLGFRKSWDAPEIMIDYRMDSETPEAREYLKNYLTALREHLAEKGWLGTDKFCIGIADEPNEHNCQRYRELAEYIKSIAPEIPLYEAISAVDVGECLDIYIPRSDEYEKARDDFEDLRKNGKEIWQYICLFPRKVGYINRFLDIPLLATRYVFWGNYLYGLTGYLHWATNAYQSEESPFEVSCPVHINADSRAILPPGDDKLVYPGDGEPLMSIRLENHRESAEEYEMLRIIAEHDKNTADLLITKCMKSFHEVDFSVLHFEEVRREIIREYEKVYKERLTL